MFHNSDFWWFVKTMVVSTRNYNWIQWVHFNWQYTTYTNSIRCKLQLQIWQITNSKVFIASNITLIWSRMIGLNHGNDNFTKFHFHQIQCLSIQSSTCKNIHWNCTTTACQFKRHRWSNRSIGCEKNWKAKTCPHCE